jgi:hypothetical protein
LNKEFHNSPSGPGANLRDFVGVKLTVLFPEYIRTPAGMNRSLMTAVKECRVYREINRFI